MGFIRPWPCNFEGIADKLKSDGHKRQKRHTLQFHARTERATAYIYKEDSEAPFSGFHGAQSLKTVEETADFKDTDRLFMLYSVFR